MTENTFYQDLLAAQKEIEAVDRDGENPYFKSGYTSLNSTIESCKQVLNKHNIIVLQPIKSTEIGVMVCTTLIHTSGQSIESNMVIRESKQNDPQSQGSAITYARRYSLKSLLTMTDEDDDGNKAQDSYKKEEPVSDLAMMCKVHNKPMQERKNKLGNLYFGHIHEGQMCFGR